MKALNSVKYKNTIIHLYTNGQSEGNFPFEYSFEQNSEIVYSRTSYNCIEQCLMLAKEDYDAEQV